MGFIVLIILALFISLGQNIVAAQEPTFGPICDGVTVTCPPSPSPSIPPIGQTGPTPTPTQTPIAFPSATPVFTAIPQSGNASVTIGFLIVGALLVGAGHLSLLLLRR